MSLTPEIVVSVGILLIVMLLVVTSPDDGLTFVMTYFPGVLLTSNVAIPSLPTLTLYLLLSMVNVTSVPFAKAFPLTSVNFALYFASP